MEVAVKMVFCEAEEHAKILSLREREREKLGICTSGQLEHQLIICSDVGEYMFSPDDIIFIV